MPPLDSLVQVAIQSPLLAAIIVLGWMFNRYYIESLRERKEILQSLNTERQEATASRERLSERYAAELVQSRETQADIKNQMHALRGKLGEVMLTYDKNQAEILTLLREIQNWMRGQKGGGDD